MASINDRLVAVLKGASYLPTNGLADYHAAKAVKAALRRKEHNARLMGVREALRQYRVTSWLDDDGTIEFRRDGQTVERL